MIRSTPHTSMVLQASIRVLCTAIKKDIKYHYRKVEIKIREKEEKVVLEIPL